MALQFYFCSTDTASHMEIWSRGSCRSVSVKTVQQHGCVNGHAYGGDVKLVRTCIWKGNSGSVIVFSLKCCFFKKPRPRGPRPASCWDKLKRKIIKWPEKNQSKLTLLCFQSLRLLLSHHLNLNQTQFTATDYFRWSEWHLNLIQMSLQSLPKKSGHPFYSFPTSHLSKDSQATLPPPPQKKSLAYLSSDYGGRYDTWAAGPSGRSDPVPVETHLSRGFGQLGILRPVLYSLKTSGREPGATSTKGDPMKEGAHFQECSNLSRCWNNLWVMSSLRASYNVL